MSPFFRKYGDNIKANSPTELLNILAKVDHEVNYRIEGRSNRQRERFCITILLKELAEHGILRYPIEISKSESPDYLVQFDEFIIGIEHRDIGSERAHRSAAIFEMNHEDASIDTTYLTEQKELIKAAFKEEAPIIKDKILYDKGDGKNTDSRWLKEALKGIEEKTELLNRGHFKKCDIYHLLLNDSTMLYLRKPTEIVKQLIEDIKNSEIIQESEVKYTTIHLIRNRAIYFDILGDMQVLVR